MVVISERLKQCLRLGREHYNNREFAKARPLLFQVVAEHDDFADVHNMLGVIAHEQGNFAEAQRHLERAVSLNMQYTEALLNLAVVYNDQGKYDKSLAVHRQIRALRDRSADNLDPFVRGKIANMHADLSQAYYDAWLVDDAIRELRVAVSLCPTFADLHTRLGTLLRDTGDLHGARQHYEAAKEANPRYAQARLMLGMTLFALNELAAAKAEWQAVLRLDPTNRSATMYLRMADTMTLPDSATSVPSPASTPSSASAPSPASAPITTTSDASAHVAPTGGDPDKASG